MAAHPSKEHDRDDRVLSLLPLYIFVSSLQIDLTTSDFSRSDSS